MKKTFLIDALRNIQKRIVSWLSIVAIVLIGTSVILGLHFPATSLSSVGARQIQSFQKQRSRSMIPRRNLMRK